MAVRPDISELRLALYYDRVARRLQSRAKDWKHCGAVAAEGHPHASQKHHAGVHCQNEAETRRDARVGPEVAPHKFVVLAQARHERVVSVKQFARGFVGHRHVAIEAAIHEDDGFFIVLGQ